MRACNLRVTWAEPAGMNRAEREAICQEGAGHDGPHRARYLVAEDATEQEYRVFRWEQAR
jgi:hypothetical protein